MNLSCRKCLSERANAQGIRTACVACLDHRQAGEVVESTGPGGEFTWIADGTVDTALISSQACGLFPHLEKASRKINGIVESAFKFSVCVSSLGHFSINHGDFT